MNSKHSFRDYMSKINKLDYILFALTALFCFFSFSHVDVATTAHNASSYLNGNILNFYTGTHELNGGYGANYLPSTFIVYAIWNVPLKILSLFPQNWGVWNSLFVLWNKLLPTIIYFVCAYLIYKMCAQCFKFSEQKSKLAAILFASSPIGFYSQLIFGQYDIFTVLFMLLGIYFYFSDVISKKKNIYFILFFSIAITFKYFSLLIFLVLLLLKEKNIWKILWNTLLVLLPTIISGGIYFIFDREAFTKSVLGFGALDYVQNSGIVIANFVNIQYAPVLVILILAFAYFKNCTRQNELLSYATHFCCGICLVIFGFMNWHPQWLLFAIFFWTVSFLLNPKINIFLWIEIIFGLTFNLFVASSYTNSADQSLLKNGILSSKLYYKDGISRTMTDIYHYDNRDMLFSILFAIMLIYFIFSHPHYTESTGETSEGLNKPNIVGLLRSRFWICILTFIIPAILCLPSIISQYNNLWQYTESKEDRIPVSFNEFGEFSQKVTLKGKSISEVILDIGTYGEELKNTTLTLSIYDEDNNCLSSTIIQDNLKDGQVTFNLGIIPINNNSSYSFIYSAVLGDNEKLALFINEYDGTKHIPLRTYQRDYDSDYVTATNKPINQGILDMKILGDK